MKYQLIVFDMAGTVVDEDNVVYKTLREVINEAGFSFTLDQVLAEGAGKEKLQATKDILKLDEAGYNENLAEKIFESFLVRLENAYHHLDVKPQPGAEQLFKDLKSDGVKVVLNTGYNRATAELLLEKLGWRTGMELDLVVTASDVENNRPLPDMIQFAMHKLHVTDSSKVVKVGDSIIDIEEGRNARCGLSIGITTGAHTRAQLESAKPDFIIDRLSDLPQLLN